MGFIGDCTSIGEIDDGGMLEVGEEFGEPVWRVKGLVVSRLAGVEKLDLGIRVALFDELQCDVTEAGVEQNVPLGS